MWDAKEVVLHAGCEGGGTAWDGRERDPAMRCCSLSRSQGTVGRPPGRAACT